MMTSIIGLSAVVAPREGRVSRNSPMYDENLMGMVAPREGRVSRNLEKDFKDKNGNSRAPRGACE